MQLYTFCESIEIAVTNGKISNGVRHHSLNQCAQFFGMFHFTSIAISNKTIYAVTTCNRLIKRCWCHRHCYRLLLTAELAKNNSNVEWKTIKLYFVFDRHTAHSTHSLPLTKLFRNRNFKKLSLEGVFELKCNCMQQKKNKKTAKWIGENQIVSRFFVVCLFFFFHSLQLSRNPAMKRNLIVSIIIFIIIC